MVTILRTGSDSFGHVRKGVNLYFSSTVSGTFSQFGPTLKPACSFLTVPRSKLRTSEVVETALRHASIAKGVNWYEVQLFCGALPKAIHHYKALA